MIKIAVFNQKGGVGKTTLTVNLASVFNERWHKKVLVVDADAQCNASSYLLANMDEKETKGPTIYDMLKGKNVKPVNVRIVQGKRSFATDIDIIKGDKKVDLLNTTNAGLLQEKLKPFEDSYSFCFLDCSAQKTTINLLALGACDFVIVPIEPDVDSINGYDMVRELTDNLRKSMVNPTIEVLGIVVNGVSSVGALDGYLKSCFESQLGDLMFESTIRQSALLKQARYFGLPINYYKKKSNVTLDYYACALEIMERASRAANKTNM